MNAPQRDYAVFDAELAGKSFNARLIARLFVWVRPHWRQARDQRPARARRVGAGDSDAGHRVARRDRRSAEGAAAGGAARLRHERGSPTGLPVSTGMTHLLAACVLYMIATTAWAIAAHYHRVYLAKSVLNALRDLRYDLFSHLETRPASFYDHVAVGRVMTRVTNDIEVLFQLLSGFGVLIGEFVPFLVAFSLMLAIDAKLTGILMLAVPIVAFATYLFRRGTRTVYRAIRQSISQLNQNLQENLSGIQVVQLNRREDRNLARYTQINQENRREENRAVELETFYGAFIDSLGSAAVGAIIWFGGGHALQQTISLGSVVLFTQFVDMLFRPIVAVGEQYNVLFRAMASAERIFQALDWSERIYEPAMPATLPARLRGRRRRAQPELRVFERPARAEGRDVPHRTGRETRDRRRHRIGQEHHHSPVGALLRFRAGTDVPRRHRPDGDSVRRKCVAASASCCRTSTSSPAASPTTSASAIPASPAQQVETAARLVHAHDFIMRLPGGYDEPLIERGQNLSQGQRQLLAFARVLAADPEILVLDEATASIDTETELLIQDALRVLTKGRTSIVIAHRLQTIQEADRVLVLQHGEVKEVGTHEQLLSRPGVYRTLYELQFQDTAA